MSEVTVEATPEPSSPTRLSGVAVLERVATSKWPSLAPHIRWVYEPKDPKPNGDAHHFVATRKGRERVEVRFHVPLSSLHNFIVVANLACRAANEIYRGQTHAHIVRR